MSKLGKLPVAVPTGVTVTVSPDTITVKGPKGELKQSYDKDVKIEVQGSQVIVTPLEKTKQANSDHGLYRSLIRNMVVGVTTGFSKSLVINGVGFRAEIQGKNLVMNLGFSNDFVAIIPDGLTVLQMQTVKLLFPVMISRQSVNSVLSFAVCVSPNRIKERVSAMKLKLSDVKSVRPALNKVKLYV